MSHQSSRQATYADKRNILNKSYLVEPIIRHRIQDSLFYKQFLYLSNEETVLPVIVNNVKYIGGVDLNGKPSPFLCCLLRLLELEPGPEVIEAYLEPEVFQELKYLGALVLLYIRMAWSSKEVYQALEKYYTDFRKLRVQLKSPIMRNNLPCLYSISFMDVWIDDLLRKERQVDIILPRLVLRGLLEERGLLEPLLPHYQFEESQSHESLEQEIDSD